ncbi:MAG: tetratricopeptide repeat protein [Chloroflexota bacterium]
MSSDEVDSSLSEESASPSLTDKQAGVGFVDNNTCAECHANEFEQWVGSHHDQAMQPATDETVLGDFNDVTFADYGVTSRFFKRGGEFVVNTLGDDGEYADFTIEYTFGVEPLQQYLLSFPDGRYQAFTVAWDTQKNAWFNLYPDEEIPVDDPLHWTHRHFIWNSTCAECHSTDLKMNYDPVNDSYNTEWAEVNVSCQSCHGPGEAHVAWANQEAYDEDEGIGKGLVVDYVSMDAQTAVETCARCHSRRYPISLNDNHSDPFLDHFVPELLREEVYHPDGQILDEVFVYGSYLQSKMYQQGVSCMNCHNPHTGDVLLPGNELCATCHQESPPTQVFPTLQSKVYDSPDHHFHTQDSTGAQCVNCHMPAKNYMVVDPRGDHSFRIPRPDLSIELGTPNACTQCHTDQEPAWAVATMNAWYGEDWQQPHYGQVLAAGQAGVADAPERLRTLVSDESQPTIVRASALDLLRLYGEFGVETLQTALTAESALMRAIAAQALGEIAIETQVSNLAPLLTDSIRAVRIEAANALAAVPPGFFDDSQQTALDSALAEYEIAQLAQADQPEGHANLGSLYARQGKFEKAERAYGMAITRSPYFYQAHNNLANLYYQQGDIIKAELVFREAIEVAPNEGLLHYSLALLLVEQERPSEAMRTFDRAAELLPDAPRVQYNYGLILQQFGRMDEALAALRRANELQPQDPDFLYALIVFHMQREEWMSALPYAEELVKEFSDVPEFQELLSSLRSRL